ncbi:Hypothetical protein HVR_LOCUS388 [uncultured virus]|nr:Hypothetical protein HVR_LOCUS388 [uncultured virus]
MGRSFYIHLSRSSITINNIDRITEYFHEINTIKNFNEFFDSWKKEDLEESEGDIIEGEYELTYHNDGEFSDDEVRNLMEEVIKINGKYGHTVNMTLKVFEDGDILTYWIIRNNIINSIGEEINNLITRRENEIIQ